MSSLDNFLDRSKIQRDIMHVLESFDSQCRDISFKRGIYIYGSSGSGKTHFVMDILRKMNYDVIKYDAGDTRNKNLIDSIASNNMSNNNVLNMMYRRKQKIAILMDEIEAMNSGDKWGITSLIKLIRQKKTKRQKSENQTFNPIICISNYNVDKKIKELMKVCHVFELVGPNPNQMHQFLHSNTPVRSLEPLDNPVNNPVNNTHKEIVEKGNQDQSNDTKGQSNDTKGQSNYAKGQSNYATGQSNYATGIVDYAQGDLRKLFFFSQNPGFNPELFQKKVFNEDSKRMTQRILEKPIHISDHLQFINETDRTIVALLWHENIVDQLQYNIGTAGFTQALTLYHTLLKNICFADYIDRITFQNQIWQFNEMSSLIKTMENNHIFHNSGFRINHKIKECRFTKILTKYSTEYNNAKFVSSICSKMEMDRKDVISFFQEMRIMDMYSKESRPIHTIPCKVPGFDSDPFEDMEITKLDIKRFYRYLDQSDDGKSKAKVEEWLEDEDIGDEEMVDLCPI